MNVPGYRLSGAALCCARSDRRLGGHGGCQLLLHYALVVAEPCAWAGARLMAGCNSFQIHFAWSVCTAVRTVRVRMAH